MNKGLPRNRHSNVSVFFSQVTAKCTELVPYIYNITDWRKNCVKKLFQIAPVVERHLLFYLSLNLFAQLDRHQSKTIGCVSAG